MHTCYDLVPRLHWNQTLPHKGEGGLGSESGSVTTLVATGFLPLINKHQPLHNVMCNTVNHSLTTA